MQWWAHTDAVSGNPVKKPLVSLTNWVKSSNGSWKNLMDINWVYPASTAVAQ